MSNPLTLLSTCLALRGNNGAPVVGMLTPSSPVDSVAAALERSTFVFTARVNALAATTTGSAPASACTMVVVVDPRAEQTYLMPFALKRSNRRLLTVVTDATPGYARDTHLLVFGYGISADSGTALRQVAVMIVTNVDRTTIERVLAAGRSLLIVNEMDAAIARSAVVMTGTVDSVASLAGGNAHIKNGRSPYLPAWREAIVRAHRTFKTDTIKPGSRVPVMFLERPVREYPDPPSLASKGQYLLALRPFSGVDSSARRGISTNGRYVLLERSDVRPPGDTIYIRRRRR